MKINYDPILGCTGWEFTPPEVSRFTPQDHVNMGELFMKQAQCWAAFEKHMDKVEFECMFKGNHSREQKTKPEL